MFIFAQIISYLSNPLVIVLPTAYALVYKTTGNATNALWWAVFSCFFGAIIAGFVIYGVRRGFFNDFDVSERRLRKPLFIVAAIVAAIYFIFVLLLNGPKILLISVVGVLLGIFADSIINSRVKASIHVATFTAFVISLSVLYGGLYIYTLFLIPVVAWSRIMIKRHTIRETIAGALLGVIILAIMYIAVKLLIQ